VLCCIEMGYCVGCSVVRRGVAWCGVACQQLESVSPLFAQYAEWCQKHPASDDSCIRQLFLFYPLPSTVLTSLLYHVLCCTVLTVRTGGECLLRGPSPRPPRRAKRGCQRGKYGPLHCIPSRKVLFCVCVCVCVCVWVGVFILLSCPSYCLSLVLTDFLMHPHPQ
jgi:hypothetical protein